MNGLNKNCRLYSKWHIISPSFYILIMAILIMMSLYRVSYSFKRNIAKEEKFLKFYRKPTFAESLIYYAMDYAKYSNEYNDVLFIGDSACLSGIITRTFEKVTGLRAYNLSAIGWIEVGGLTHIIRAYINNHPKPKAMVLSVFPTLLAGEKSRNPEFKERFLEAYVKEVEDVKIDISKAPYYLREGLRRMISKVEGKMDVYLNEERAHRPSHIDTKRLLSEQGGFMEDPRKGTVKPIDESSIDVSAPSRKALREIAELTKKKNILMIVRLTPVSVQDEKVNVQPLIQWLEKLEKSFPNIVIDRPELIYYPDELFVKRSHVNIKGAVKFTDYVSKRIPHILKILDLEKLNESI